MYPRQALVSALHLFVVFVFFGAGLFFVALPYLPETRIQIVDIFSNQFERCTTIGLGLFLAALLFLTGFYALNRGQYLVIQMGISADIKVIRQTVEDCLLKHFPRKITLRELDIGVKDRLEFKVHLAPLDEAAREQLLIEAERQLSSLLQERFGYTKPFHFIVKI